MGEKHLKVEELLTLHGILMQIAMFLLNYILIAPLIQTSQQIPRMMDHIIGISHHLYHKDQIIKSKLPVHLIQIHMIIVMRLFQY